ncbi:MAG: AbrB family transcriptional regulator [Betaproteobacteria bacterium]|nr:AbrB family transcriptional regulator [Betaproteobacteria bacterium]
MHRCMADVLTRSPAWIRWMVLVLLSAVFSFAWATVGLPASLLLGPMVAGIVLGANGVRLSVPRPAYLSAQATIGAMVSASITPAIVAMFAQHWLLFTAVVLATLLGGAALGWLLSRWGLIAGPTAVYGTSPGAAAAMVLQAEANGADMRLVAFMQYLRVLMVVTTCALVARFWAGDAGVHPPGAPWGAAVDWGHLALLVLLAGLSQQAARRLRVPAWGLLGPMIVLSALHATGVLEIELPRWLLAAAYALLGWSIGLTFRRDVLLHAWRSVPVVAGAAACLILFCAALGGCLMLAAKVDALTAYLATSPGGLDSVAVIAASTPQVDLPFVLALQSLRLVFAIAAAPLIARLVVRYSPHLRR